MSKKRTGGVSCQSAGGGEEHSGETNPLAFPAGHEQNQKLYFYCYNIKI